MQPLLELMDACLAMGLEGRFQRAAGGASALANLRTDLSAKLATLGGARADGAFSVLAGRAPAAPPAGRSPSRSGSVPLPFWHCSCSVYLGFDLRLGAYSERLGPVIARLTPPIAAKSAESIAQPPSGSLGPRLAECLAPAGVDRGRGVGQSRA